MNREKLIIKTDKLNREEIQKWIVNAFLDNFYKDNYKRYASGV